MTRFAVTCYTNRSRILNGLPTSACSKVSIWYRYEVPVAGIIPNQKNVVLKSVVSLSVFFCSVLFSSFINENEVYKSQVHVLCSVYYVVCVVSSCSRGPRGCTDYFELWGLPSVCFPTPPLCPHPAACRFESYQRSPE